MSGAIWWDKSLPLWVGCSRCSPGCDHCYAVPLVHRLAHNPRVGGDFRELVQPDAANGLDWSGSVTFQQHLLTSLMARRRPADWFVSSLGDWGHPAVTDAQRLALLETAAESRRQRIFTLTKRPAQIVQTLLTGVVNRVIPNVWIGITAENQATCDQRWEVIRPLAQAGWHVFLSAEPLLGPMVLPPDFLALAGRTWVICGGETGPLDRVRPPHPLWVRRLVHQCLRARVPIHFKSWGALAPASSFALRPFGAGGTIARVPFRGERERKQRPTWIAYPDGPGGDAGEIWVMWPRHRRHSSGGSVSPRMIDGALHDARPEATDQGEVTDVAA